MKCLTHQAGCTLKCCNTKPPQLLSCVTTQSRTRNYTYHIARFYFFLYSNWLEWPLYCTIPPSNDLLETWICCKLKPYHGMMTLMLTLSSQLSNDLLILRNSDSNLPSHHSQEHYKQRRWLPWESKCMKIVKLTEPKRTVDSSTMLSSSRIALMRFHGPHHALKLATMLDLLVSYTQFSPLYSLKIDRLLQLMR